jgi:hypothetical protein
MKPIDIRIHMTYLDRWIEDIRGSIEGVRKFGAMGNYVGRRSGMFS